MIKKTLGEASKLGLEQLFQLIHLTWDGDLISKQWTNKLLARGYINKANGWNIINKKGIVVLTDLGLISH